MYVRVGGCREEGLLRIQTHVQVQQKPSDTHLGTTSSRSGKHTTTPSSTAGSQILFSVWINVQTNDDGVEVTEPRRTDRAPRTQAPVKDNPSLDRRKQLITHQPWVCVAKGAERVSHSREAGTQKQQIIQAGRKSHGHRPYRLCQNYGGCCPDSPHCRNFAVGGRELGSRNGSAVVRDKRPCACPGLRRAPDDRPAAGGHRSQRVL